MWRLSRACTRSRWALGPEVQKSRSPLKPPRQVLPPRAANPCLLGCAHVPQGYLQPPCPHRTRTRQVDGTCQVYYSVLGTRCLTLPPLSSRRPASVSMSGPSLSGLQLALCYCTRSRCPQPSFASPIAPGRFLVSLRPPFPRQTFPFPSPFVWPCPLQQNIPSLVPVVPRSPRLSPAAFSTSTANLASISRRPVAIVCLSFCAIVRCSPFFLATLSDRGFSYLVAGSIKG